MHQLGRICLCGLGLILAATVTGYAEDVSPRQDVRDNFQRLVETNDCQGCDLSGAVLNRFDLSGVNLAGANLAGAKLYLVDLSGANLTGANLQGAALGGADLAGADLTGANLTGAILEGAYLVGAKMDGEVTTRRPYVEEGGPPAGETVFVEDEAKSKNLPFTGQPVLETDEKQEAAGMQEEGSPAETGEMMVEQAETPVEQAPAASPKKLVMIKEPVIVAGSSAEAMKQGQQEMEPPAEKMAVTPVEAKPMPEAESVAEDVRSDSGTEKNHEMTSGSAPPAEMVVAALPREKSDPAAAGVQADTRARAMQPEAKPTETAAAEMVQQPAAPVSPEKESAVKKSAAVMMPSEAEEVAAPAMDVKPAESRSALIEKLLDDNRCVECDLSGADLAGKDLDEADLERADFRDADLHGVDLREANLKGVNFRGANLREADLREADMYRADLTGADLTGARFEGTLIDSIRADNAVGVDFTGAVQDKP